MNTQQTEAAAIALTLTRTRSLEESDVVRLLALVAQNDARALMAWLRSTEHQSVSENGAEDDQACLDEARASMGAL
jgi:hypothetical protein